ncbi:MarR family winged helix-turn-helix transcriptional regulator [Microbacterium sp. XT11]|uniref:MarR family winged helix-turn-helix transcriptional regulator n=1 Tax=Microbacterium sp. XT11 TaxID=367477 RepID=UPI000742EBE7|nr:hypothetical protein [Microbacterium sp. XT11]ALX65878.1 hypothetical protein AB663_000656 [Microbacterium sp. XT11]
MNTTDNHTTDTPASPRPFGFWITAVDRLLAAEFATAFEREGANRRDWRLLNVIDGTVPAHRPLRPHKLRDLEERGWITREGEDWTLTDEGRAAKERLCAIADGIRATITDAVSPEDYETTVATLEKIATALGWEDGKPLPRRGRGGHGGRHGHGGRDGHDGRDGRDGHDGHGQARLWFGGPRLPRRGFPGWHEHGEHGHGERGEYGRHERGEHGEYGRHGGHGHGGHGERGGQGHGECGHGERGRFGRGEYGHGHERVARLAQHAYKRGFDAGFSQGRAS